MTTTEYHQTISVTLMNGNSCPQCGCPTFNHLKVTRREKIFSEYLDEEFVKEEINCEQCGKMFTEAEYQVLSAIPNPKVAEDKKEKIQFPTVLITPEGIKEGVQTVFDKSKVLPQVEDETLFATTIMALMCYTTLCDETIDLNHCNNYHDLFDNYPQCVADLYDTYDTYFEEGADLAALETLALQKFILFRKNCYRPALEYLLRQGLSPLQNKYVIPSKAKFFWFRILDIYGTPELQRESKMKEFLTPSVF